MRQVVALDQRESIIVWALTQHRKYRERYESAMDSPRSAHLHVVRLRSRAAIDAWVDGLGPACARGQQISVPSGR